MEMQFPVILDGATGTELQKRGFTGDMSAEQWVLEHPESILEIQRKYVASGSNVLYAPTFGGNRQKLEERGIFNRTEEMNKALAQLSKQAADGKAWVAGDIAPTGRFLAPLGDASFEELVDIYTEQAAGLEQAGVDLYVIETMMTLTDARAAVLAIRSMSKKPILVSFTCDESGKILSGTDVVAALSVMEGMGVSAFGLNCSAGPEQMLPQLQRLHKYARVPLIAKPNAGMPEIVNGEAVYNCPPEEFAALVPEMLKAGVALFGGCCGTTPEFIRLLNGVFKGCVPGRPAHAMPSVLCTPMNYVNVDGITVVGERINPTGKKRFQQALRERDMNYILEQAVSQAEAGAQILDVNVGAPGVDEPALMEQVVKALQSVVSLPLQLDSSNVQALENGLRVYNGKPIVNSADAGSRISYIDLAAANDAICIALCSADGIAKDNEERMMHCHHMLERGLSLGMEATDLWFDPLFLVVKGMQDKQMDVLNAIKLFSDEGLKSTGGLSNNSNGAPKNVRPIMDSALVAMAMMQGLTSAIVNPNDLRLMETIKSCDIFKNNELYSDSYLDA